MRMTTAAELPALLAELRGALEATGARTEALAEFVPERRTLGFRRRPTLRAIGRAWPLGVLLLGVDGALFAGGTPTRSKPEARVGYTAESARERDALRHTAARAGFATGEPVRVDPTALDAAALAALPPGGALGPVLADERGALLVRWSPAAGIAARPVESYLREEAGLLTAPGADAG